MVWPEGKENWSGGSSVAQQCGFRGAGPLRPVTFFKFEKDGDSQRGGQGRGAYRQEAHGDRRTTG